MNISYQFWNPPFPNSATLSEKRRSASPKYFFGNSHPKKLQSTPTLNSSQPDFLEATSHPENEILNSKHSPLSDDLSLTVIRFFSNPYLAHHSLPKLLFSRTTNLSYRIRQPSTSLY